MTSIVLQLEFLIMTKSFIGRCNVSGAHRPRFDYPPNLTGGCKASVLRGDDAAIFDKKRCCCVTSETSDTDIFPVNDFDHIRTLLACWRCHAVRAIVLRR